MRIGVLLGVWLGLGMPCYAAIPDQRIRTETYDKNQVYTIYTQVGRATLIQLEADESLVVSPASVLGIGDAAAWNLGVRGNNIVLKPSRKMPQTNVVLVTNKRTYSFELQEVRPRFAPTYVLRFWYPEVQLADSAQAGKDGQPAQAKPVLNTHYVWRGKNRLLKPTAAYDDGRFTRLIYDNGAELPVFYKILPDDTEALINTNIDPKDPAVVVLHEVIRKVRVRLGKEVIEVINKAYVLPKINSTGTSVPGQQRMDKANAPWDAERAERSMQP